MLNILALGDNNTLTQLGQQLAAHHIDIHCFNPLSIHPLNWQETQPHLPWSNIDKIIVISKNAAIYGANLICSFLAPKTMLFAIGHTTAKTIQTKQKVFTPSLANSESLLELPSLQAIAGEKILLFKGRDGRTLLAETLQKRGGILYTIDCYERKPIIQDLTTQLIFWQAQQVQQIIVSSVASMQAFISQVPPAWHHWLQQLTWVVTSPRLAKAVQENGFHKIKQAKQFSVAALANVLL